jgi:hypothetical protein
VTTWVTASFIRTNQLHGTRYLATCFCSSGLTCGTPWVQRRAMSWSQHWSSGKNQRHFRLLRHRSRICRNQLLQRIGLVASMHRRPLSKTTRDYCYTKVHVGLSSHQSVCLCPPLITFEPICGYLCSYKNKKFNIKGTFCQPKAKFGHMWELLLCCRNVHFTYVSHRVIIAIIFFNHGYIVCPVVCFLLCSNFDGESWHYLPNVKRVSLVIFWYA